MARGRLIFPFLVDIYRLDAEATAADPDDAGPLTTGYDDDFREPVAVAPAGSSSAIAAPNRIECLVQLRAQIETDEEERLQMMLTGRSPNSRMSLVFHYAELEAAGMVVVYNGNPRLQGPGDRLGAIRNVRTRELIEEFPESPGLFAVEVQSIGWGLGTHRNLLLVTFEERELSIAAVRS